MEEGTFLTPRQVEVMRLRAMGLTQEEVAERMGTTKQNVSSLERRAKRTIERAKRTLRLARMLTAPVWIEAHVGDDIEQLAHEAYRRCDEQDIHIVHDRLELLSLIRKEVGDRVRHRLVVSSFEIAITREGEVLIQIP
ncbi:Tfx family DNA-binding protein [Methermicoccus shengliensis]|uniref:Tfx family DNA-binding protein n=1 Tax=Methermicoccus shengliensis TaxID=660064 RepID=A0A832RX57_9EURY|nr:Tfx family DNA-binding protein [Methermicoccus shengliensis]KUK04963.1 MAG: DNA-binding protein tfx [Euryarchaeota archaeon 55_53]KUK30878.1 MAG: DNA-binding protein tfx [Methanosarcinales archeaon 56_1174]MDI3487661.1 HTH-type transcriptional regulator, fmd operon transcriptional regulator [Methanosarcinales archaeon]MDN5294994.1 HTH-type transcriptional regulator, fmd operon transcriptional regulator [Methanosarcinales archaeon]HIH69999.1 Tfx family DNA-binding protein [Methermicoccus she